MGADEIVRFRREIVERTGDARAGDNLTDQERLREVMNTGAKTPRKRTPPWKPIGRPV
ncbi:MAG TPA: hypothetical protein PKC22_04815 [Rhodocyclaceae bacterium]|nr:hypothetical protein [Rhodocyclaceae bacterium]